MKRIYQFIFLLFACGNLLAQNNIVQYEYWLNNDYAAKVQTTISPVPTFNLQTTIPSQNLDVGFHALNFRFKDSKGLWSSTLSSYFYKMSLPKNDNTLVYYEYWLNDFYNEKQTGSINNLQSFVILDDIDIRKATKGTNYIHYRFKDIYGQWSSTLTQDFYRPIEPGFTYIVGLSEVTFSNTTKCADIYEWDFGDGNKSAQVNPIHTYAEPGAYEVKLVTKNKMFSDSIIYYPEIEGIKKISNNKGGNGGFASFDVYGGGLDENTVVKLIKDDITISTHTLYKKEPGIICAMFDLTGKNMGFYDIIITSNGKTYTFENEFEIVEEGFPAAWAEIEGNVDYIPGRWQTYKVNYGNIGNADIYGLPVNLILSDYVDFEFLFDLVDNVGGESTDIKAPENYVKLSTLYGTTYNGKMYSFLIPHIPANTSGSFSFRMKLDGFGGTNIYATVAETLNDIYFYTQPENIESNEIFGYELIDSFNIKKESLSQQIRDEIDKSFKLSPTVSRKSFVNFSKFPYNRLIIFTLKSDRVKRIALRGIKF